MWSQISWFWENLPWTIPLNIPFVLLYWISSLWTRTMCMLNLFNFHYCYFLSSAFYPSWPLPLALFSAVPILSWTASNFVFIMWFLNFLFHFFPELYSLHFIYWCLAMCLNLFYKSNYFIFALLCYKDNCLIFFIHGKIIIMFICSMATIFIFEVFFICLLLFLLFQLFFL